MSTLEKLKTRDKVAPDETPACTSSSSSTMVLVISEKMGCDENDQCPANFISLFFFFFLKRNFPEIKMFGLVEKRGKRFFVSFLTEHQRLFFFSLQKILKSFKVKPVNRVIESRTATSIASISFNFSGSNEALYSSTPLLISEPINSFNAS